MRIIVFLFCLLLLGNAYQLSAQRELITITKPNGSVEFPFQYINNFIVVTVTLNDVFPLQFIFDTGAENTVLTQRELTDMLNVTYRRKVTIYGSDLTTELKAYVATGIDFSFAEQMRIAEQTILVLEEDYFRFAEFAGLDVHGILGADILRRFIVKIDYQRRKIVLQDPSKYHQPRKHYQKIPADFSRYKPYITLPSNILENQPTSLKLLMDTGASLSLLLYTNKENSPFDLPDNIIQTNIGMGLGGNLTGFVGRTAQVDIGNFELYDVITNYQDISPQFEVDSTFLNKRHGIIGNKILDRFSIIIDYINGQIYFRPNRKFRRKFNFDRSGLSFAASGFNLTHYTVINVIPGSPADEAGIQVGDEIRRVNGAPTILLSMENMIRRMQRKPGKRIKLIIRRDSIVVKKEFELRELI